MLEQLRRSDISIDADGELWHQGQVIAHRGLRAAIFRWLDRLPDGRYVMRLDERRFAYLTVADTPLVARAARVDGDTIRLALSDGTEEALDPATLRSDTTGTLRCRVRGGRLPARLATSAAVEVARLVDDTPHGPELVLGGRRYSLGPPSAG